MKTQITHNSNMAQSSKVFQSHKRHLIEQKKMTNKLAYVGNLMFARLKPVFGGNKQGKKIT